MWAVVLLALLGSSVANKDAIILASKSPLSLYAVENMDLVMEYQLFNVGDKPATDIVLDDRHSFPTNSFDIIKGLLNVRWNRLDAGKNVTHSVVVRPRAFGMFNYTVAQVSYHTSNKALHVVYSTSPGEGYIYRQKEYDRKFAPKYTYFLGFFAIVAPTTLLAYYFYSASQSALAPYAKKK